MPPPPPAVTAVTRASHINLLATCLVGALAILCDIVPTIASKANIAEFTKNVVRFAGMLSEKLVSIASDARHIRELRHNIEFGRSKDHHVHPKATMPPPSRLNRSVIEYVHGEVECVGSRPSLYMGIICQIAHYAAQLTEAVADASMSLSDLRGDLVGDNIWPVGMSDAMTEAQTASTDLIVLANNIVDNLGMKNDTADSLPGDPLSTDYVILPTDSDAIVKMKQAGAYQPPADQ